MELLPECLTSPEMKEFKAYKTYLGYATGVVPPKITRKFKKASPTKKDSDLVPTLVETNSKGKEKEKVDVAHGKGIELLSKVALTEKVQLKEVRKKSLRDFHKTHPSSSGTVSKKTPSVEKITHAVTSEGTGDQPGVPNVTEDDSTESESESWGNDEDDNNNEQEASDEGKEVEVILTPNDDIDVDILESESDDENVVQGEGADAEMDDAQQETGKFSATQEQVVEDAHVTISNVTKKTKVHVTSSSCSFDLASKFLNFLDIPHDGAEIVSPLDVQSLIQNDRLTALEIIEVAKLKKDPIHTQVTTSVDEHLDIRLGETREEFMKFLTESLTTLESKEQKKVSSQSHSTYEAASTLTEFELKKILIDKMEKTCRKDKDMMKGTTSLDQTRGLKKRKTSKDAEPTTGPKNKDSMSSSSKGTKSQPKPSRKSVQSEEPVFEVADSDMPQDQEGNLGDNDDEPRKEDASRRDWFKKPTPPQEPTDPDWHEGKTPQKRTNSIIGLRTSRASTSTL
ncbi:hypothetical protein Tco_0020260 [Tanacetum coccineum]